MSSSKDDTPKSEKQRIWELEEQLEMEQHEHKMTKFALRKAREKMGSMSNGLQPEEEIMDLENVMAENEDLKETLKMRDEKIGELERQLSDHEGMKKENLALEGVNKSLMEELDSVKEELRIQLEQQSEHLEKVSVLEKLNKETVESMKLLESERDELKMELGRQSENLKDASDLLKDASDLQESLMRENRDLESKLKDRDLRLEKQIDLVEDLKRDNQNLRIDWNYQSEKLKDYEKNLHDLRKELSDLEKSNQEALELMKVEVNRLHNSSNETFIRCQVWMYNYSKMVGRLIEVLKKTNSNGDSEEVKKLEEDQKNAVEEQKWWNAYHCVCSDLSKAFEAINDIKNGCLRSKEQIDSNQSYLNKTKQSFERLSGRLGCGIEVKERIRGDLESKYFVTWQRLLKEASEKINRS